MDIEHVEFLAVHAQNGKIVGVLQWEILEDMFCRITDDKNFKNHKY